MAEFPAFPLWTDAYLGDTTHLTTIEHGAYLLLLIVAWRSKDGLLPDDDNLLARYTKLNKGQWKKIRPILESFFTIENGKWKQGRLLDELEAVKRLSKRQSDKVKARWLKNKNSDDTAVSPGYYPSDTSPYPSPTPSPRDKDLIKKSSDFDVDKYLTDLDRECTKAEAPGWDLYFLIKSFNEFVRGNDIPKYPAKAFLAWVISFTKGKQP